MAEKRIIDIQKWPRREHYHYFGELDDPYFGITAKADFTSCYMQAKEDGESFFLYSLHKILRAVNAVEDFYRKAGPGRGQTVDVRVRRSQPRSCRRLSCRSVLQAAGTSVAAVRLWQKFYKTAA